MAATHRAMELLSALACRCLLTLGIGSAWASAAHAEELALAEQYADVLGTRGDPRSARDRAVNAFFDQGAWHGYSLQTKPEERSGFVGPLLLAEKGGVWMSRRFAEVEIRAATAAPAASAPRVRSRALPGRLEQYAHFAGVDVKQTLILADSRTALVRIELRSGEPRRIALAVRGGPRLDQGGYEIDNGEVQAVFADSPWVVRTRLVGVRTIAETEQNGGYRLALADEIDLAANRTVTVVVEQSYAPATSGRPRLDAKTEFERNAARWNRYLASVLNGRVLREDHRYARVAVKAVQTLIANWRSPKGDLEHAGLFPSYSNDQFHGFWAWDSWKHAAALARFAPELARDQMRAMFDYQNEAGMIADVIYARRDENNWRNTKPPLAAWAAWEIYRATGDRDFLAEMLPKLLKYHRWWYAERDHDRDGLAEYGSTDGTRIAAAWESGMDNAVRFDHARMLRNGAHAWSLDQESVDLNSFLYLEKLRLAEMAGVLGDAKTSKALRAEARAVRDAVRERMFDPRDGYFYDVAIADGAPIRVMGPEGWSPLWTGLASDAQARRVARHMLDPRKFATFVPFPTLAADHPQFSPVQGYWRGPVWIDQAYFAVEALRRSGLTGESAQLRRRLLEHAAGLLETGPFYENYDPLTGQGVQSPNFGWSAAHCLLLLLQ